MKVHICVIGKSGAGKETVYKIVKGLPVMSHNRRWRVSIHHFSDPLNEALDVLGLERSRPNQQILSTKLREVFGEEILGTIIYGRALKDKSEVVFLDGIRRPQDVVMLRKLINNHLIFVDAKPEIRWERLRKRADRPGDAEKTWEQFQEEQKAETESMIEVIAKEADCIMDNSGTLEELESQVKDFLNIELGLKV